MSNRAMELLRSYQEHANIQAERIRELERERDELERRTDRLKKAFDTAARERDEARENTRDACARLLAARERLALADELAEAADACLAPAKTPDISREIGRCKAALAAYRAKEPPNA